MILSVQFFQVNADINKPLKLHYSTSDGFSFRYSFANGLGDTLVKNGLTGAFMVVVAFFFFFNKTIICFLWEVL